MKRLLILLWSVWAIAFVGPLIYKIYLNFFEELFTTSKPRVETRTVYIPVSYSRPSRSDPAPEPVEKAPTPPLSSEGALTTDTRTLVCGHKHTYRTLNKNPTWPSFLYWHDPLPPNCTRNERFTCCEQERTDISMVWVCGGFDGIETDRYLYTFSGHNLQRTTTPKTRR